MKSNRLTAVILGGILLLVIGCSKDNPTEPSDTYKEAPDFVPKTISVPQALQQSTNLMAQRTNSYIVMANAMTNLNRYFTPPSHNSKITSGLNGNSWIKTWDINGLTVTLTITENDTGYHWQVQLNGTDSTSGESYNNWTVIEIEENKQGTAGKFTLYEENSTDIELQNRWYLDSNGVSHFEVTLYEGGNPETKTMITVNPDNSGEILVYEYSNGVLVPEFKAVWQANGSGEWWSYDSSGNVEYHGSWS